MKIDIKYSKHKGKDVFIGMCILVEVVEEKGKKLLRIWFVTSEGLIAESFPRDDKAISEDSYQFIFLKNLLGEEPPEVLNSDDLIGKKCYLDTETFVNYQGYIYSEIVTTYPIFKTEAQREQFYSNCSFQNVWGADNSIEESSSDYEYEGFFEPTEEDFFNFCHDYDSN